MQIRLQKEKRCITAPTRRAGVCASYDSFDINQTIVFQITFCGKSPTLRVAAIVGLYAKRPKF